MTVSSIFPPHFSPPCVDDSEHAYTKFSFALRRCSFKLLANTLVWDVFLRVMDRCICHFSVDNSCLRLDLVALPISWFVIPVCTIVVLGASINAYSMLWLLYANSGIETLFLIKAVPILLSVLKIEWYQSRIWSS